MLTATLVPLCIEHNGCSWQLWQPQGEVGGLLLYDLFLAERLDYPRPWDIRELIQDMQSSGKLGVVFARAAKTSRREGRPTKEYYLTQQQAWRVATQAPVPRGGQVARALVQAFLLARRGVLVPAAPGEGQQSQRLVELQAQVAALHKKLVPLAHLLRDLREQATLRLALGGPGEGALPRTVQALQDETLQNRDQIVALYREVRDFVTRLRWHSRGPLDLADPPASGSPEETAPKAQKLLAPDPVREAARAQKEAARTRRWERDRQAVRTLEDPAQRAHLCRASPEGCSALHQRFGPVLPWALSSRHGAELHGKYHWAGAFARAMEEAGHRPLGRQGRSPKWLWRRADCEALRRRDLRAQESAQPHLPPSPCP